MLCLSWLYRLDCQHLNAINLRIIFNRLELNSNGACVVSGNHKLFNNGFVLSSRSGKNVKIVQDQVRIQGNIEGALSWPRPIGLRKMQAHGITCVWCEMRNCVETVTNTGRLIDALGCGIRYPTGINNA